MMESQRIVFDKLVKQYSEYLELYKVFNNGSVKGATSFEFYYWQMTYLHTYHDPRDIIQRGY